jgi:hypothetical protein
MNRLIGLIISIIRGLSVAVSRFPLTVACLGCAAVLISYMIYLDKEPDLIIQKLMFTFLLGAFLGIAAQFSCERFERLSRLRVFVYTLSALLAVGYYLILLPAADISFEIAIRTLVAVFAMFCVFLYVPSYRGKYDFNAVALSHFKSVFTSVLYSGVLTAGCASIIGTIDILLFAVNDDAYAYMMTIIWVLFACIYYLSLLPRFNSQDAGELQYAEYAAQYPRFLEILISYIAIPLLAAYTLVLAVYFVKILVTLTWPSGQLGAMVLAYSAAGLILFILSSRLDNRFARSYCMIFPKVLIPVVIMQLISVGIRLDAYGITESRYYVALFGVFSIICGIFLSLKPISKNGIIALLAAFFAIFSVIPPVDAFTVSRVSQITRLESMLTTEGILVNGEIKPRAEVSKNLRIESTSILSYLENRSYIKYVKWLPDDFKTNKEMENVLGFEPAYTDNNSRYFFAHIDMDKPFNISGYDICFHTNLYRTMDKDAQPFDFELQGIKYQMVFERVSPQEVQVSVKDSDGVELVGTGLYEFTKTLSEIENAHKKALSPETMTFDLEENAYKLRIIFENINITNSSGSDAGVDCSLFILFGAPD